MFERMVESAWWVLSTLSSRVMLFLGAEDVLRSRGQRVGHTFGASIIGNADQHRAARVPLAEGDDPGLVRRLGDKIVIAEAGRGAVLGFFWDGR
ncbi:hypothetical protein [Actinopolyspora halophila]|uniref:hypothetical protein n=1 Tax=Actinopolyspora halophila TaxID=1850 RepID=UPI000370317B|nr:hypothetical protein [Actinopolyspora halophila]